MKRAVTIVLLGLWISACSKSNSPSPSTPSPAPAGPTRIISLGGNLIFGPVALNTTATGLLTITNTGNGALTVSGISSPCGSMYTATFISGTIAAGATQNSTIRFTPTAVLDCSGSVSVTSDATSGTATIPITASGVAAPAVERTMTGTWRGTWSIYNFTMVLTQAGSTVTGTYQDQDGSGKTDPAEPGSFTDPNLRVRMKQTTFGDFTFTGAMDSSGVRVTGTVAGAGVNGTASFTMTK